MVEADTKPFRVPASHPIFAGHFPGRPIVPGVMLLERVLNEVARVRSCSPAALLIREAKFFTPLQPDESAQLQIELGDRRGVFVFRHEASIIARGIVEWRADD